MFEVTVDALWGLRIAAPTQEVVATVQEFIGLIVTTYRSQEVLRLLLRSEKIRGEYWHKLGFMLLGEVLPKATVLP